MARKSYSRARAKKEVSKAISRLGRAEGKEATRLSKEGIRFSSYLSTMQGKLYSREKMSAQSIVGIIKRIENMNLSNLIEHYDIKSDSFKRGALRGSKKAGRQYKQRGSEISINMDMTDAGYKAEALNVRLRQENKYLEEHRSALTVEGFTLVDMGDEIRYVDMYGEIVPDSIVKKRVKKREEARKKKADIVRDEYESARIAEEASADDYRKGKKFTFDEVDTLRVELLNYFKKGPSKGIVGNIQEKMSDTLLGMSSSELKMFAEIMQERGITTVPDNYEEFKTFEAALGELSTKIGVAMFMDFEDEVDDAYYDESEFGVW